MEKPLVTLRIRTFQMVEIEQLPFPDIDATTPEGQRALNSIYAADAESLLTFLNRGIPGGTYNRLMNLIKEQR